MVAPAPSVPSFEGYRSLYGVIASPPRKDESESWREMERKRPYWRIVLAVATATVALAFPGAGQAALLGDALPGLLSPAGGNPVCDENAYQAFRGFGDSAYYVLMPGGAFEGGNSWALKGGAKVVRGNESYYVHGRNDVSSLYLPSGASATTPAMCFDFADWHLRFFARDNYSGGKVRVTVHIKSLVGVLSVLDAGTFDPSSGWRPSPRIGLLISNLGGLLVTDAIQFRFTAVGGSVQLDDAYLDPWKNT
jgi:hypothetical protein